MYVTVTLRLFVLTILAFCSASYSFAETFTTTDGKKFTGKIGGVYGPVVLISSKTNSVLLSLDQLDDASLDLVAAQLAAAPAKAVSSGDSKSAVAQALKGRLVQLKDGKLQDYIPSGPEPEFYLVYFSAHWCGPCRRFTPSLVKRYHDLKQRSGGDRFELVFVSSDNDAAEQHKYITSAAMPWPAVKYSQLGKTRLIEKWAGNGIPCLVVLNRDGDLLYHSYNGQEYLGPQVPLDTFTALLGALDEKNPMTRKARYRLVYRERMRAAPKADADAEAYYIPMDRQKYPLGKRLVLDLTVEVDPNGRVNDIVSFGNVSSDIAAHVRRDAHEWLFLPAIKDGKAVLGRTTLSIAL